MKLTLVRHGVAQERGEEVVDSTRELTELGRDRMKKAVRGMQRLGFAFDELYFSPLVRAAQTAELLAPLVKVHAHETPLLAERPSPELLKLLTRGSIAFVGHEPWLSELAAWLVTGDRTSAARFALKKGGAIVLEGKKARPGGMTLTALLTPKVLRKLR